MIDGLVAWIVEEEDSLDSDLQRIGKNLYSYYNGVIQPLMRGNDRGDIPAFLDGWEKANEAGLKKCSKTFDKLWSAARNLEDYAQQSAHESDVEQARDEWGGDPDDFDPDMIETNWETAKEYAESEKDSIESNPDYKPIMDSVGGKPWFWKGIENKGSDWNDEIENMHREIATWVEKMRTILNANRRLVVSAIFDVAFDPAELRSS